MKSRAGRLTGAFSVIVVLLVGLVVLAGYFLDLGPLGTARRILIDWAVALAAVAVVVGAANLLAVHSRKISTRYPGWFSSIVLVVSFILALGVFLYWTPTAGPSLWIFRYIQVPIEASLTAILAIILAYAAARVLGRRASLVSLVFVLTVLFVLLGTASIPGMDIPIFRSIRQGLQLLAAGGARGILLGVALGSVATGLRVLAGADRPYGE